MTATPTTEGAFCTSWGGRVVGDRVGGVDYDLDILREDGGGRSGAAPRRVPRSATSTLRTAAAGRRRPGSSFGGGLGAEPGEDPRAGRVARRSPAGLIVYSGTADPDVRYLTFATPSDVRTLAPSGPAHAFLIVYAGGFPTGDTIVTTTFNDGRTRRDTLANIAM